MQRLLKRQGEALVGCAAAPSGHFSHGQPAPWRAAGG
jgi:hypothetical protein